MGLDRTADAMLVARSDAPGGAASTEIAPDGASVSGDTARRGVHDRRSGRGRGVRRRPPGGVPGGREARRRCCSRTSACRCPRCRRSSAASSRSRPARDTRIAVVAHAGDGNTHPLIVYDATDPDADRARQVAFGEIMDLATRLGGTITGEHGVGRLKKAWLPAYLGAGRHGAHPADQGRARPAGDPESGRRAVANGRQLFATIDCRSTLLMSAGLSTMYD